MAQQVKELPEHGRSLYPWRKWTNGRKWKAWKGIDFQVEAKVFRRQVATRAVRQSMNVTTRVDGDVVTFQFSTK